MVNRINSSQHRVNFQRSLSTPERARGIRVPSTHTFRHTFSPSKVVAKKSIKNQQSFVATTPNQKAAKVITSKKVSLKKNLVLQQVAHNKAFDNQEPRIVTDVKGGHKKESGINKTKIYLDKVVANPIKHSNPKKNYVTTSSTAKNHAKKAVDNDSTSKKTVLNTLSKKNTHNKTNFTSTKSTIDSPSINKLSDQSKISPFDPLPVVAQVEKNKKNTKKNLRNFVKIGQKIKKQAQKMNKKITQKKAKNSESKLNSLNNCSANNLLMEPEPSLNPAITDSLSAQGFASQMLANEIESVSAELLSGKSDDDVKKSQNVHNLEISSSGAVAIDRSNSPSLLQRLAGQKITFTFKIDSQKIFAFIRILAIMLILVVSGYLAWDTWMTNRAVNETFSPQSEKNASAMSIVAANPSTADSTSVSKQAYSEYNVPADQPRYITIPSIGVSARVMAVGVTSDGNIGAPQNLNDTAWYDGSAKPDQEGQVFIDGHTSFASNLAAAFNALSQIKKGAKITLELGDGQKVNYSVVSTEVVNANSINMSKVLSTQGNSKKGLSLMTCTGTFNYRTQTSDKRLIVYAEQES